MQQCSNGSKFSRGRGTRTRLPVARRLLPPCCPEILNRTRFLHLNKYLRNFTPDTANATINAHAQELSKHLVQFSAEWIIMGLTPPAMHLSFRFGFRFPFFLLVVGVDLAKVPQPWLVGAMQLQAQAPPVQTLLLHLSGFQLPVLRLSQLFIRRSVNVHSWRSPRLSSEVRTTIYTGYGRH